MDFDGDFLEKEIAPLLALPFIYRFKLYALFINQWFVI